MKSVASGRISSGEWINTVPGGIFLDVAASITIARSSSGWVENIFSISNTPKLSS